MSNDATKPSAAQTNGEAVPNNEFLSELMYTTSDVWDVEYVDCSKRNVQKDDWKKLWRESPQKIPTKSANGTCDEYEATLKKMTEPGGVLYDNRKSHCSSDGANIIDAIWPTDFLGRKPGAAAQIAHLLPKSTMHSGEWIGIAAGALGLEKTAPIKQWAMATRGVANAASKVENSVSASGLQETARSTAAAASAEQSIDNPTFNSAKGIGLPSDNSVSKRKQAAPPVENVPPRKKTRFQSDGSGSRGTGSRSSGGNRRFQHTGVVHFVSNKLRMMNQGTEYDGETPTFQLIPAMSLEDAKAWNGGPYKAVGLPGPPYMGLVEDEDGGKEAGKQAMENVGVATDSYTRLWRSKPFVEVKQQHSYLNIAHAGLREAILAVISYAKHMLSKDKKELAAGLQSFGNPATIVGHWEHVVEKMDQVPLPKARKMGSNNQAPGQDKHVILVEFGGQNDADKHPAPDPLLLYAKAVAVWGKMCCFHLLANGERADEEESEIDSLDEVAESEFLETFRNTAGPLPLEIQFPLNPAGK